MMLAFLMLFGFGLFVWLVFFKFKWLKFTKAWAVVSLFMGVHVFLIFVIGLRFVTPYSANVKVVQYTIQLVPRLPEPTLVTAVLVAPNVPVKKGQPLFQFDRRPYEYQVRQLEAQLEAASAGTLSSKFKVAEGRQDQERTGICQVPATTLSRLGAKRCGAGRRRAKVESPDGRGRGRGNGSHGRGREVAPQV